MGFNSGFKGLNYFQAGEKNKNHQMRNNACLLPILHQKCCTGSSSSRPQVLDIIFPTVVQHPHSFLGGLFVKVFRSHSETHRRTPLNEWCVRRRELYLTTHNTHKRQTAMHPEGFEAAIPASNRPEIHAVECVATGID